MLLNTEVLDKSSAAMFQYVYTIQVTRYTVAINVGLHSL